VGLCKFNFSYFESLMWFLVWTIFKFIYKFTGGEDALSKRYMDYMQICNDESACPVPCMSWVSSCEATTGTVRANADGSPAALLVATYTEYVGSHPACLCRARWEFEM
jgi:hypothetical protein